MSIFALTDLFAGHADDVLCGGGGEGKNPISLLLEQAVSQYLARQFDLFPLLEPAKPQSSLRSGFQIEHAVEPLLNGLEQAGAVLDAAGCPPYGGESWRSIGARSIEAVRGAILVRTQRDPVWGIDDLARIAEACIRQMSDLARKFDVALEGKRKDQRPSMGDLRCAVKEVRISQAQSH
jgi:hypothetical protein